MGGRFLVATAVVALTVGAAGCGGGASTSTGTTQAAAQAPPPKTPAEEAAERKAAAEQHAKEAAEERATKRREAHEAAVKRLEGSAGHGLGTTKAVFEANNTMTSQEGTEPPEGTDYYRITESNHDGRVTGYEVTIHATPPFSNHERIALLGGVDLPNDAEPLPNLEHSDCYVWRSADLKRLIGMEYAEGTTGDGTSSATMQAVSAPKC